jgi:hypothetical protein
MTKFKIFLLPFLLLQLLLPTRVVLADTGPKPTMDFAFKPELTGEPVTITSGTLYECEQSDCSDAAPLEELGPQRFTCEANSCRATAYGFAPYHKIEIEFSDGKTRQSNIFETAGFDSKYTVTVRPDDLLVEAQFNLTAVPSLITIITILVVCACALVGVGLVLGLIIFLMRRSKKN